MEPKHQVAYGLCDSTTGQVHLVPCTGARIGRIPENDIVVPSNKVSRYHAVLWVQNGDLYIRDEGSTNGTWVDSERIDHPTRLGPGSRVKVADHVFEVVQQQPDLSLPILALEDEVPDFGPGSQRSWVPYVILGATVVVAVLGLFLGRLQRDAAAIGEPPTTLRSVETRVPTPTVTLEPTSTITPTLAPTETPPPTAVPAPTSPAYASPCLMVPDMGKEHRGPQGPLLQWRPDERLSDAFYYRIIVDYSHDGGQWREIGWSQEPTWRVPEYVGWLLSEPWECHWYVEVVKVEDWDATGKPTQAVPVSEPSETWTFRWPQ